MRNVHMISVLISYYRIGPEPKYEVPNMLKSRIVLCHIVYISFIILDTA